MSYHHLLYYFFFVPGNDKCLYRVATSYKWMSDSHCIEDKLFIDGAVSQIELDLFENY